jgi:hypothetical protein
VSQEKFPEVTESLAEFLPESHIALRQFTVPIREWPIWSVITDKVPEAYVLSHSIDCRAKNVLETVEIVMER